MSTKSATEGDPTIEDANGESPDMWSSQQQQLLLQHHQQQQPEQQQQLVQQPEQLQKQDPSAGPEYQQHKEDKIREGPCGRESSSPSAKTEEGDTSESSAISRTPSPRTQLPLYRYSKEELLALKDAPLSKVWPESLDAAYAKSPGRWDPERWIRAAHDDRRPGLGSSTGAPSTTTTTTIPPPGPTAPTTRPERPPDLEIVKRSSRDPRERVKQQEEQDGVVLSPQRRSFSTGCHGLQQSSAGNKRPVSPNTERPQRESHREIPAKRIGSGRISRREPDQEAVPVVPGERGSSGSGGGGGSGGG